MEFIDLKTQQTRLGDRIPRAIQRVLDHGRYIMGPEVQELEAQLARFSGARHVISCASGTDALVMALMAKEAGPGDAIFVPAFTFVATAEAVALLGATPVFVDVDPHSYLLDLASLKAAQQTATRNGLTPKGVIPVDLFGQPCAYTEINRFAREQGLFVIADAAQSFGARLGGSRTGALAELTTTSFFPAKPLGCYGDGGALFTDDDELADRLRSLRVHGKGKHKYDNVNIGLNGRLDTMQAAILLEKLSIFAEEIMLRDRIAQQYGKLLEDCVEIPVVRSGCTSVWAQYTITTAQRDAVAQGLKQQGIPSAVYYPSPLHRQTAYAAYPQAPKLTVSERLSTQVLSLPMHPYLEEDAQHRICAALRQVLQP
ncbi:MAG: DegT/DnrJ/EryC1/StrS family aminotransferase [Gammaproteobacteria bacterium]|nr:DegT/DnrJ/EryC1/StrS family aminotransferase [Gammaproteobacteria bacterium]MCY4338947.1 DegT/DnrJ/EryC1/StrS family aminotransferase [Gammaproteobacteria bacterium]